MASRCGRLEGRAQGALTAEGGVAQRCPPKWARRGRNVDPSFGARGRPLPSPSSALRLAFLHAAGRSSGLLSGGVLRRAAGAGGRTASRPVARRGGPKRSGQQARKVSLRLTRPLLSFARLWALTPTHRCILRRSGPIATGASLLRRIRRLQGLDRPPQPEVLPLRDGGATAGIGGAPHEVGRAVHGIDGAAHWVVGAAQRSCAWGRWNRPMGLRSRPWDRNGNIFGVAQDMALPPVDGSAQGLPCHMGTAQSAGAKRGVSRTHRLLSWPMRCAREKNRKALEVARRRS